MTKAPTRTVLKKKCDTIFSLYIRARDQVCQACFKNAEQARLQCAHIFSRRYLSTRWDPDNAICLCKGCHYWYTERPIEWEDFICDRIGDDAFYDLRDRARVVAVVDYEVVLANLEELMASVA